jgi:predicted nucleic acid-binding protein
MKDKFFIDTSIIIYSFDSPDSSRREISKGLIKKAHMGKGCISFQVIQEFLNVATRKFERPLKTEDAQKYLSKILFPICEIFPSEQLYFMVLELSERWKYSFYDSLIIAAALEAGCSILYSEGLQDKQRIYQLDIVNPYR